MIAKAITTQRKVQLMPKYTITVTFHPETFEFDTDDHPEAFAPQGDELADFAKTK